jgi:plasmid stability protein
MPDILVRDVPKETVDALKRQAEDHGRSLQQEVKTILQTAGKRRHIADYVESARRMREKIASYAPHQTDSTLLIRKDRER